VGGGGHPCPERLFPLVVGQNEKVLSSLAMLPGFSDEVVERARLTRKELEALRLYAGGAGYRSVALALDLSRSAVRDRISSGSRKLERALRFGAAVSSGAVVSAGAASGGGRRCAPVASAGPELEPAGPELGVRVFE
jgi:predicted DNA-binding protein (UPF0251 family)